MSSYDPRKHGALCNKCPLYGCEGPVPPETYDAAEFVVLARSPGHEEVEKGRPLVGAYGTEITGAIRSAGGKRKSAHWTNVLLCSGYGNDWLEVVHSRVLKARKKVERENKQELVRAKKDGRKPVLKELPLFPEEACRPRLIEELKRFDKVLAIGKEAFKAVTGKSTGIMDARGTLNELPHPFADAGEERQMMVLPTTLDLRRFREIMRRDVGRAVRWFKDELQWVEPQRIDQPTVEELRRFLYAPRAFTVVDVETKAKYRDENNEPIYFDPLTDILRLIGFSEPGGLRSWVVQFESVELTERNTPMYGDDASPFDRRNGGYQFYAPEARRAMLDMIARWCEDIRFEKVGHNITYYDAINLEETFKRELGRVVRIRNMRDTILMHHVTAPEYKHNLGFCGSFFTDVPAWKEDDTANTAASDGAYREYNSRDTGVNARIEPMLAQAIVQNQFDVPRHWGYPSLIDVEHGMAAVARGMHRVGMYVDQSDAVDKKGKPRGRQAWFDELTRRMAFWRGEGSDETPGLARALRELGFDPDTFNPNSRDQIGELLFNRLELPIAENVQQADLFTKSGERSTGDAVLRSYVSDPRLNDVPWVRAAIHALRLYRRWAKLRATFVRPLEPSIDENGQYAPQKRRYLRLDGRVHPDYKAFGTKVGRLAATGPNTLNLPSEIRSIFVPQQIPGQPKRVYVGADQSALHLRIIACLWQIPSLLEAFIGKPRFHRGERMSAHELFAELLFEEAFMDSEPGSWPPENPDGKWKKAAKGYRDTAKTTRYAGAYGAKVPTMHREITSAEEKETGKLTFAHMTMQEVEDIRNTWLTKEPQWEKGWAREIEMWQEQGYLESPILGRRSWFLEGKETDVVNYRVIACVPGFSRITTDGGLIPIQQLVGRRFQAWTGKKWAPATAIPRGQKELWRVRTDRTPHLYASADHRYLAVSDVEYQWREVEKLTSNTRVAIDLARELEFGPQATSEEIEDAYWAGFWIADGSARFKNNDVEISFTIADEKKGGRGGPREVERCLAWAAARGLNATLKPRDAGGKKCSVVSAFKGCAPWMASWDLDYEWRSHSKRVPERIWRSSLAVRKAFFRGVLQDGSFGGGRARLQLANQRLIDELWLLARTIGLDGSIEGPFSQDGEKRDQWRLVLSLAQLQQSLEWGEGAQRLRTSRPGMTPWWEAKRLLPDLKATSRSDAVLISRIRRSGHGGTTSPYVLARMGVENDVYDHATITSTDPRRILVDTYTLVVDDPEHRYVSDGAISKNCEADLMNLITCELVEAIPFEYAGPGTGLVNQNYDSVAFEVPEGPPIDVTGFDGKPLRVGKEAWRVANIIREIGSRKLPGFEVPFEMDPKIGAALDLV